MHLTEEELIDHLLGEPPANGALDHLAACQECREQLELLGGGLQAARTLAPPPQDLVLPRFSAKLFRRRVNSRRWLGIAAAALVIASILGLRVEVSPQGFVLQFSFFQRQSQTDKSLERIAELENRLANAIEVQHTMTQYQLDARFNALYQERDQDLGQFAQAVEKKLRSLELSNAELLTHIREDLKNEPRQTDLRKWQ